MLRKIDAVAVLVSQQLCDTLESMTGMTKFVLEKWAVIIAASLIIGGLMLMHATNHLSAEFSFFLSAILVGIAILAVQRINEESRLFLQNPELVNSAVDDDLDRRFFVFANGAMLLLMLLVMPALAVLVPGYLCTIAKIYISAAIPRQHVERAEKATASQVWRNDPVLA